ncbi:hypothetical protein [Chthonomonas calidirosea]|uniref:hypothetical protein n=1 Tax=Chthonomonas calidirosea TaxID=454171 RepID=UPI0012DEDBFB|nr:hypothetical protein [Chthonomonas calidirosea]
MNRNYRKVNLTLRVKLNTDDAGKVALWGPCAVHGLLQHRMRLQVGQQRTQWDTAASCHLQAPPRCLPIVSLRLIVSAQRQAPKSPEIYVHHLFLW